MKLKMFLSDYQYRQMLLKDVAMKITELPIVKQVYHHYRINRFKKENKNLDDCITFILNQVKASGCCGMTDDEVWSLAIHYYDEDNIDVGKPISCGVVVNHKVELTEEEKAQARKDALKAYQEEEMRKIQQRHSKPKPTAKAHADAHAVPWVARTAAITPAIILSRSVLQ